MNLRSIISFIITVCVLTACSNKSEYGETFDPAKAVSAQEGIHVFTNTGKADQIIQGEILKVCQSEGCWFTYKLDSGDLFVDFQHKFEIPMNSAGKTIIALGSFVRDTTSVDQLREYAKDDGKSEEEINGITEPEVKLNFIAKGVRFTEK